MMKKAIMIMALFLLIVVGLSTFTFAVQENLSLSEKEIIEKLARLEEGQKGLNKRIDDLRGELKGDIDGLRSELKGNIGELGNRIDDLRSLIYVVLAGIIALIGFVIWDRRTALSPVISKTRELEERDDLTVRALKEYARREPKMAEVLKSLGIL
jgi:hypothetical protein